MHATSSELIPISSGIGVPLRVISTCNKGRGVVADREIACGELIERAPVLIIPEAERGVVDATNAGNYIFMWEHNTVAADLYTGKGRAAVILGHASLVNHSDTPNCDFVRFIEALTLDLFALRTIRTGEELTIDYGLTLWFTPE